MLWVFNLGYILFVSDLFVTTHDGFEIYRNASVSIAEVSYWSQLVH